ncbi:hypothetical protein KY314_02195 [Candidatus Woesearchaeota archaeon]|nr:hypothetical protein [Candidatus Woesearchaeota archaeon]
MREIVKTFETVKEDFEQDYFWQNPFVYEVKESTLGKMIHTGLLEKLKKNQTEHPKCLYVIINEYLKEPIPLSINNVKIFCNKPIDTLVYRLGF